MFKRIFVFLLIFIAILAAAFLALRRPDISYETLERAYANEASRFIMVKDGLRIHYRDEGPRDGETLVLVHGFAASLHTWEPWVERLKTRYRVISLDLPGHGLSRVTEAAYPPGPIVFADVVGDVADALELETFVLVGSSMGGNTAWTYALTDGDRLEGLVLVGASGWPAEDSDNRPLVFRLLDVPVARRVLRDLDLSALIEGGLRDSFVDQALITDDMIARYGALSRAPARRGYILELISRRDDRTEATTARLSAIAVPTLILHGEADAVVPASGGRKFHGAIPGSELVLYPEVGHLPQEEIPDQSVADLEAFLATIRTEATAVTEMPVVATTD